MTLTFTITPESISHTDIKLAIRDNYAKYLNYRHKYVIYCSYDLFCEEQDYINKLIQDIVAEFGMKYLVVPAYDCSGEKKIAIIFDTSRSLFDDTMTGIIIDEKNFLHNHCENQRKEITLLLKQKAKLEKELEACKNHQVDMLTYRDDIIGQISREKNELENANKSQTNYIKEMDTNMAKGNQYVEDLKHDYRLLKDKYDRARYDYDAIKEKYDRLFKDYGLLEEKYQKRRAQTIKYHSVYEFEQLKERKEYYREKVHELFDMLLTAEFIQKKEEQKDEKEVEKDD